MPEHCPTCGSVVSVVTADEGTSSFRPSRPHLIPEAAVEAMLVARYGYAEEWPGRRASVRVGLTAALPHLLTDEMVEDAAEAIADEFGYALDSERHEEMYDAPYWKRIAQRALEAALGGAA